MASAMSKSRNPFAISPRQIYKRPCSCEDERFTGILADYLRARQDGTLADGWSAKALREEVLLPAGYTASIDSLRRCLREHADAILKRAEG